MKDDSGGPALGADLPGKGHREPLTHPGAIRPVNTGKPLSRLTRNTQACSDASLWRRIVSGNKKLKRSSTEH